MTNTEAARILSNGLVNAPSNHIWATAFKMAIKALEEQNDGEWIPVTNGRGGHECSKCHSYAPSYQSGDEMLANFCPNCGVRMEIEHE